MNIKDKKAPANAEADKKMVIRRYDCKTGEVTESYFSRLLNANLENDFGMEIAYDEVPDVVIVVSGSENRDVFEAFKETINKINRRRKHHGGEGIRFHISLVGTTSISS